MSKGSQGEHMRGRRRLWYGLLAMAATIMLLPLTGYVYVGLAGAQSADAEPVNPRSEYWRDVRQGGEGYTAVTGPYTSNRLIQNGGEVWREIRNGPLATFGAGIMGFALVALVAFHLATGGARLEQGRSGERVYRWNILERVVHWYVAILFIVLAITGLSLLYGRAVLVPLLGREGNAAWAGMAMVLHNYLAVFFVIGLAAMLAMWFRENFFQRHDWEWFKQGGGYFGKHHPHAAKVNGGEKLWFWILFFAGIAVSVSGFYLNFPNLGFQPETMQIASILHSGLALVLTAFLFGHIYLGTLGNEGTFEGMISGYVDRNWAKQHHDLWYEEAVRKGQAETPPELQPGTPNKVRPTG